MKKIIKILELMQVIPERKINSETFNEIFQIDGIPLMDILEPLIKSPAYLPRPFKNLAEIEQAAKNKKYPSIFENLMFFALGKGFSINEGLKRLLSAGQKPKAGFKKRDILFLSFTNQIFEENGNFDFFGFGEVLRDLQRKKLKPLVLVCDLFSNPFFKIKKHTNIPDYLATPYNYMDKEVIQKSRNMARELHRKWKSIDKSKLFTFKGKNYWPFLKDEMNFVFSEELLFVTLSLYMSFKKIIQVQDIKIVYITGGGLYERALLAAARKLGKQVIYSPHGYAGSFLFSPYSADKFKDVIFISAGEEQKKELMRWGIRKENIVVTGSPFFDKIAEFKLKKKANELEKVITFLTDDVVESKFMDKKEYFSYVRRYLIHLSRIKNVKKIVIKLHPNEKYKSEYESIVRSLGLKNVEVVQNTKKEILYSILRDSDLLINFGSTACVEGLMLDKDAILIGGILGDFYKIAPYKEAVVLMDKDDDLTRVTNKVLNDKKFKERLKCKREKYLRKSFYKIDGKSHERVADLISSLLNGK